MTNRVVDLSERPVRLSVRSSLLVIRDSSAGMGGSATPPVQEEQRWDGKDARTYRWERLHDAGELTIPLADVAVLIASHPQISLTHAVLSGLAAAGGIFVACDQKHMPASMLLPLAAHSLQAERFARQAAAPLPLRKRLWQEIVRAKIRAQARLLVERTGTDDGLCALVSQVRSGDPANVEARAARVYWVKLFGHTGFKRDPEGDGLNGRLNYGYAVLRAITARALCGAGLHPGLGIHHHNRYDAFPLADDLMEPFRPAVDRAVANLHDAGRVRNPGLDTAAKRALLEPLLARFNGNGESRTLFDWIAQTASSLATAVESGDRKLDIPALETSAEGAPRYGLWNGCDGVAGPTVGISHAPPQIFAVRISSHVVIRHV
ncbi:MAG TPA: type II CRISPR-associated endonuclease Cas1 [Patescibacteria group bacterium]|nr:type II CRISPR-associated endonuclease Cas1 [Patescibacteria group bacterium]